MGEIENSMAIFVVATYGEGDPTDNAQEFYEWLQNDRDDLDCLHYTVRFSLKTKGSKQCLLVPVSLQSGELKPKNT